MTDGANQKVTFTGTLPAELPTQQYLLCIVNDANSLLYFQDNAEANVMRVSVTPDPATSSVLGLADDISLPTEMNQNEDATLTAKISNTGGADFNGIIAFGLLESTSAQYYTYTAQAQASIPTGQSVEVQIPYNLYNTDPGTYMLIIGEVVGNSLSPLAKSDGTNYFNVTVKEKAGAELYLGDITQEDIPDIELNQPYTITFPVKNVGTVAFEGEMYVRISDLYGQYAYETAPQTVSVAANGSADATFTFTVTDEDLPVGDYYFIDLIWGGGYVTTEEGDYLMVSVVADPTAADLYLTDAPDIPDVVTIGEDFTYAAEITNIGGGAFNGDLFLELYEANASSVGAKVWTSAGQATSVAANGGTADFSLVCNLTDLASGVYAIALTDGDNLITTTDGYAYFVIELVSATDPIMSLVESPSFPQTIVLGQEFTFTAQLQNTGGGEFKDNVILELNEQGALGGWTSVWQSEPQEVTVAAKSTGTYTFTGTIAEADLEPGVYYFSVGTAEVSFGNPDGYNLFGAQFISPTAPIVSLVTDPTFASSIKAGDDLTVSVQLKNAGGGDYTGNVAAYIMQESTDGRYGILTYSTPQSVTVPANGTYDFTATVSTAELAPGNYLVGIADADELRLWYSGTSGEGTFALEIQEASALRGVDGTAVIIYPNPAVDFVMVNNGTGIDQVRLYSLTGALVLDEAVNGAASHRLDLDRLPAGAYLLSVDTPEGTLTKRIMKE